jgi:hypothetical protein
MPAVLSYIYNIGPTSCQSFLGYTDITGDGEKGGGEGEGERWNCLRSSVNILRKGEHAGCFILYIEILQETGRGVAGEGAGEMERSLLKCKYT